MIRRHQRSRLLHVLAQHLAQARMKQMRRRVIAHSGLPDFSIDDGVDLVAHAKCPPTPVFGISSTEGGPPYAVFVGWGFYDHLMRAHPLNRVVSSLHLSDDGVVIVAVKPPAIADLSAGLSIERCVIEDDLAFLSGLEFLRTLPVADEGQHFCAV